MPHPLDGAYAKLERANEQISDLKREIDSFLQGCDDPVVADEDVASFQEAAKIHASREVPARFSILSGEIIHNLRSCLDHIAWQLSSVEYRQAHPKRIEFPVFECRPSDKSKIAEYERKIAGIGPLGADLIEALQPYNSPPTQANGPRAHPLWIIHDLDRIDKHRELIITLSGFDIRSDGPTQIYTMLYRQANFPEGEIAGLARALDPNSEITPQVVFPNFGGWETRPVIPALQRLAYFVERGVLPDFDACF